MFKDIYWPVRLANGLAQGPFAAPAVPGAFRSSFP